MSEQKLKIGVIGTGSIAQFHIQNYLKNPHAELYALCDINPEHLNASAERYGVTRTYTDANEMLAALPELDAVSVCTWNSAHAPCAIAALNAGKHVLCEKPMATSAKEAQDMLDAAKKNQKLLMIGFVRRHGEDCAIAHDFIRNGTLGDIYFAKSSFLRRNGNPGGWFGDKSRSSGGPLIDLGVHEIDLTRYLMGNPKPVSVYGVTFQKLLNRPNIKGGKAYTSLSAGVNDICDVEDLASALIRYDNGSALSIEVSYSLNTQKDERVIRLFGTKGGVQVNPSLEFYSEANDYMVNMNVAGLNTSFVFENAFHTEINHFIDCIINGTPCKAPAEDGLQIMKILDAIYESARTGHEVMIEQ